MPLLDENSVPLIGQPYFKSLDELDKWSDTPRLQSHDHPSIPFLNRAESSTSRGQLLVCHDYKGGYTESPFSPCYTFNFWHLCRTFVYFSHHRVTIPPVGWTNAAHRQGVKMLGTLIFEGGADADCLRLLVGRLPKAKTGPAMSPATSTTLPVSPYYARVLANLAKSHGFDGYLLNFECMLRGGVEQTRALSAWIQLFQAELKAVVGPHAELSWYDSVIVNGRLAWQDRLNSLNLPFFLSSDTFFTNYTWRPEYPSATAQYFLSLEMTSSLQPKSLQDIYMGIDVWGRGSHGGGGFGAYRALDHISPDNLGLSVALFGQAWTWESEQDKPGWTWEAWWDYERSLWIGGKEVVVPEMPTKEGQPECPHGAFQPFRHFFVSQAPPNPSLLPFHTTFSPGVGWRWFVNGKEVMHLEKGWTDIDKQTSIGDLVWPRPTIEWYGDIIEDSNAALPEATSSLNMSDAWNGGTSLELSLTDDGSDSVLQSLWIPVQSLELTPGIKYHATAVYKVPEGIDVDRDVGLSVQSGATVTPLTANDTLLSRGWTKLSVEVQLPEGSLTNHVSLGLVVTIIREDPSVPLKLPILLGQLNMYLIFEDDYVPAVIWADYDRLTNQLAWGTATSLPAIPTLTIASPDDPKPAWSIPEPPQSWSPSFLYFNVYAQDLSDAAHGPEHAKFLGTSIYSTIFTYRALTRSTRFYVQGVTDRGEILPWTQCAYTDAEL